MQRDKVCDGARLTVVQGEQWGAERGMCVVQGAFVVRGSDNMQVVTKAGGQGLGVGCLKCRGAQAHGGMGNWRSG